MLSTSDAKMNTRPGPQSASDSTPEIGSPEDRFYFSFKRVVDAVAALVLLVLTSPLLLLAMALVKLTSRGPSVYSQTRLGLHGQPFTIYKVRTMVHECESLTGVRWSTPGDARVTAIGHWLRLSHVDELPQLCNVLRGDMSLVGPRPERPEFVPHLEQAIARYRERLLMRPGVTGLCRCSCPPTPTWRACGPNLLMISIMDVTSVFGLTSGFAAPPPSKWLPFRSAAYAGSSVYRAGMQLNRSTKGIWPSPVQVPRMLPNRRALCLKTTPCR